MADVISGVTRKIGEVRAVYNPKFRYDPTTDEVVDLDATPYARGWCHNKSAKIIVGNTGTNKDAQLRISGFIL